MNVHMVEFPAVDGGVMLVNLVDLVAVTPDEDGAMLHLRYGGDFVIALSPIEVGEKLEQVARLIARERAG